MLLKRTGTKQQATMTELSDGGAMVRRIGEHEARSKQADAWH